MSDLASSKYAATMLAEFQNVIQWQPIVKGAVLLILVAGLILVIFLWRGRKGGDST